MLSQNVNNNLEFLENKEKIEKFLNENSEKIFGKKGYVKVLDLKRSYTYNRRSYNVWYKIETEHGLKEIRASAALDLPKVREFQVMSFIFNHGFSNSEFVVPKPLASFSDYNLYFYENLTGRTLLAELKDANQLLEKVKLAAQALKKFHSLPKPSIDLFDPNNFFNYQNFEKDSLFKYYPIFASSLDKIVDFLKKEIFQQKSNNFCHGDYQPTNIMVAGKQLSILDFGQTCLLDKEYDIATFLAQLQIMLERYGDVSLFEELKESFLSVYSSYDAKKLNLYFCLINLRILVTFCVSQGKEDNLKYMPLVYAKTIDNLKKIDIKIEDSNGKN